MQKEIQQRKRIIILIVSFTDIAFGVTTIGFYSYILIALKEYLDLPVDIDISSYGNYSWVIESLNSGFLVFFNCVQVIFASILFANLIQTRPDFLQLLQKSYNWLQVTKLLFILICAKITLILLYSFIPPKNDSTFTILLLKNATYDSETDIRLLIRFICKILAVVEWIFKPVAIYAIEKFVQDLVNDGNSQMLSAVRQRNDLNSIEVQDELKSNLFWIDYKNEDIKEDNNSTSYGNTGTSQMATGSCLHSRQMEIKSLSKHFCVISSPAVTVDGNGPSTSTSSVPTSHHI